MIIPDSNFHNFGKDRTKIFFYDNQVWAAYDANEFMSHYYALIHNVISKNHLKYSLTCWTPNITLNSAQLIVLVIASSTLVEISG